MIQGDKFVILLEIGKGKCRDPADGFQCCVTRPFRALG